MGWETCARHDVIFCWSLKQRFAWRKQTSLSENYTCSSGDYFYTSSDTIGCFIQHDVTAKRNFLSADHYGKRCGLMLCFRFPNDRREKFGELLIFAWNLRKESYLGLKLVTESLKQAYLYWIILQGAFLRRLLDMSPVSGVEKHAYDTTWYFRWKIKERCIFAEYWKMASPVVCAFLFRWILPLVLLGGGY